MTIMPKNYIKLVIRVLVLVLLIFAAAGSIYEYTGTINNVNFVISVDNSKTIEELESVKQSTVRFIENLPIGTSVGIISTSKEDSAFISSNKEEITNSITRIHTTENGKILIKESISEAVNLLNQEEERVIRARRTTTLTPQDILITTAPRVIVLVTQQNNEESLEEAIQLADSNRASVYTINLNLNKEDFSKGDNNLKTLSQSTGGEFFAVDKTVLVDRAYSKISGITQSQTALELTSPILILVIVLLILGWIAEYVGFGTIP